MNVEVRSTSLPPGPRLPRIIQGIGFVAARPRALRWLRRRYGSTFTIDVPLFGKTVVVADPDLARQVFTAAPELVGNVEPNLGRVLGPGSVFNLEHEVHRRRRRLLAPPFHGKRVRAYAQVIQEETIREAASWPENEEFPTLEPMLRITLNTILRTVFGAEGAELDELRVVLPRFFKTASRLAITPVPRVNLGRWSPWRRFDQYRREFDTIVESLIARALADPAFAERADILALLLRSRYEDGEAMSHSDIADELLSLLAAGHETTATSLAWTIERLRRNPELLSRLADEVDEGGNELRLATIREVQRVRPVIDIVGRHVTGDALPLGEWLIPHGYTLFVGVGLIHSDERFYPDPENFDPDRFLGTKTDPATWIPFGGGAKRCIGAAFAEMEIDVVLRTLLRDFTFAAAADLPAERNHNRGVAFAPAEGGRIVLHRRTPTTPAGTVP